MSDTPEMPETFKIAISFETKEPDPTGYGNTTVRAYVEGVRDPSDGPAQVNEKLAELAMGAASAVYDQLGIEYTIVDNIVKRTSPPQVQTPRQAQPATSTPSQGGGGSVQIKNPGWTEAEYGPVPEWLAGEMAKKGVTSVFDNRLTRTGNQPLFREAARPGQGHGKDGSPVGFWEPK